MKIRSYKFKRELKNIPNRRKKLKSDKLFTPYCDISSALTMGTLRDEILEEDIALKEREFIDRFKEFSPKEMREMHIPKSLLFYRNKMEYTFGDRVKDGPLMLGLHERGKFHNIIEDTDWYMVNYDFIRIRRAVKKYFKERGIDFYHRFNHEGYLRHLVIRRSESENTYLLNLVTTSQGKLPDDFLSEILKTELSGEIKSIYHTINDSVGDAIIKEQVRHLYGEDALTEKLLGFTFKIGPFSFFQTNKLAAEDLYNYVKGLVHKTDTIWDLYAGSAVFGTILSDAAKKVISVEINPENIEDGNRVLELNHIDNVELINEDVKTFVKRDDKADIIVIDPPRMGLHPKVRESLNNSGVDEIIYVSCNPKTMAIDLQDIDNYSIIHVKGFYNFALTKHIEACALLKKK